MLDGKQRARLEGYFGTLELQVMEAVWDEGPVTVNDVLERLNGGDGKDYVYNTVMATMARLADKGYLGRERDGKAYVYSATTREQFLRERFAEETRQGIAALGDIGVAGIHDGMDEESLDLLRRLSGEEDSA